MSGLLIHVPKASLRYDTKDLKANLRSAGNQIVSKIRTALRHEGSGKKYGNHTASAAGEIPASNTGALARGVKSKLGRNGLSLKISAPFYARFLEIGAQGGGGAVTGITPAGKQKRVRNKIKGVGATTRILSARPFIEPVAAGQFPEIARKLEAAASTGVRYKLIK